MIAKTKVENCTTLSIFDLKKLNLLNSGLNGGELSWGENRDRRIRALVGIKSDQAEMCLDYVIDNHQISYVFNLLSTEPYIGGKRWWFQCPGDPWNPCKRRVGKLYLSHKNDRFLCRHCLKLAYKSQLDSPQKRAFVRYLNSIGIGKKAKSISHKFYRNHPTKRYQRFLNKYSGASIPAALAFT